MFDIISKILVLKVTTPEMQASCQNASKNQDNDNENNVQQKDDENQESYDDHEVGMEEHASYNVIFFNVCIFSYAF